MSFQEKRGHYGHLKKATANFGKCKSIAVTPFNGRTYVHISDNKNCFGVNGNFDYTKSKFLSFSLSEVEELKTLLNTASSYDVVFQGQEQTPPPPPPPSPRPVTPRPSTPQAMRNIFEVMERNLPKVPLDCPPQPQIIESTQGQQYYQVVQSDGALNDGEDEVFFAVPLPSTQLPGTSKQ